MQCVVLAAFLLIVECKPEFPYSRLNFIKVVLSVGNKRDNIILAKSERARYTDFVIDDDLVVIPFHVTFAKRICQVAKNLRCNWFTFLAWYVMWWRIW